MLSIHRIRAGIQLALLLVLAMVVACGLLWLGSAPPDAAELSIVEGVSIATLDPAEVSWLQDIRIVSQLYEGLYAPDPRGMESHPACSEPAERLELPAGGVRYRFRIRAGSVWSDGSPVTADDFLFAWRRALEPGTARDYSFFFHHIRGVAEYVDWRHREIERIRELPHSTRIVERHAHLRDADLHFAETVGLRAPDPRTLDVELVRPIPYFLHLVSLPVFLPLHRATVEPHRRISDAGLFYYDPQWTKPGRTAYNGPYILDHWRFKRGLRLRRNERFRAATPDAPQTVDVLDVNDTNTAWLMYETGRADWLLSIDTSFVSQLVRIADSPLPGAINTGGTIRRDIHSFETFGTYFFNVNCRPTLNDGSPNPFADPRVRRAVSLAIDREAICRDVTRRGEPPATTLVPPKMLPDYPTLSGLSFSPTAARAALDDAGWPAGKPPPEIAILYSTDANHPLIAQAVASMLTRHLGLRTRLIGKEPRSYRADKQRHDFMLARGAWFGDYPDPCTFLEIFRTGDGNNDSAYDDPVYDDLLRRANECDDPAERGRRLADAEHRLIIETVPAIPLFHFVNTYALDPHVIAGVQLNPRLLVQLRSIAVKP